MSTNVSSVTNHLTKPQDGFTTTASGAVSSGASTVGLNSTGNYSNGDIVVLIIDPADSDKKQAFTGTIDTGGSQVTGVVWTSGTNQAHASGATIVDYTTATHLQMVTKHLLVQHKQDGTHADTITTNTINENTVSNGVTVDGLNIKDGALNTNNSVVTSNITNSAVTSDKIATDANIIAYVEGLTSGQTTTNTWPTYDDASGITITFTTPASCTKILLRAEGPVSGDFAGINAYFAITDNSNNIQVERIVGISQSNAAHINTFSLARRVTVTASTSYTYKLRFTSDGTHTVVINNGSSASRPTALWVERA